MKKIYFLPMALAIGFLASCSSDNLVQNGNEVSEYNLANDGTELFVTVGQSGSSAQTRAGYANAYNPSTNGIKEQFLWTANDVFKVYCSDTWKPQNYKFSQYASINGVNGSVFTWADEESNYNKGEDATDMTNREYAVFPGYEPGTEAGVAQIKFTDEYRTSLQLTVPAVNEYTVSALAKGTAFNKAGEDVSLAEDRMFVANTLIPLFGLVDSENNKVTFRYTTAQLRVNLQGLEPGQYKLILSSSANKLSGVFESTGFDAANYTEESFPTFATAATSTDAEKSIAATFTADGTLGTEYFIYLPVVTGTYAANDLSVKLQKKGTSDYEDVTGRTLTIDNVYVDAEGVSKDINLTSNPITLAKGDLLKVVGKAATTASVTTLADLQAIFNKFNTLTRATEYDVTVTGSGLGVADDTHLAQYYTLNVPTDQSADVVVNLIGEESGTTKGFFAAGDGSSTKILKLTGGTAGKKVTITTNAENAVNLDLSAFAGELVFNGCTASSTTLTTPKTVKFTLTDGTIAGSIVTPDDATGDVDLTGTINGAVTLSTTGNVTINNSVQTNTADLTISKAASVNIKDATTGDITISDVTGNVTLEGLLATATGKALSVTTTGDIIVNGIGSSTSAVTTASLSAANVNIKGETRTLTLNTTSTTKTIVDASVLVKGTWTVNGALEMNGNHNHNGATCRIYGATTIAEDANISKLIVENGASVEIAGTAGEVATKGGTITVSGGTINALAFNTDVATPDGANGGIIVNGGTIKTINGGTNKQAATIYSSGKADIQAVENGDNLTFKSVIASAADAVTPTAASNTVNIYTGAQFVGINDVSGDVNTINLKTDINAAGLTFTGITKFNTGTEAKKFDGGSKTIENLTISAETDQVGLFTLLKSTGGTTIEKLTAKNWTVTTTKTQAGILAGRVGSGDLTVSEITINGGSVASTAFTGGLIGATATTGAVSITKTSVTLGSLKGNKQVGGLIGRINSVATGAYTIGASDAKVSVTVSEFALNGTEPAAANAGTFGYLVGDIDNATATVTAYATLPATNAISAAADALKFSKNISTKGAYKFSFTGSTGNEIGYSPKVVTDKVKINDVTFTANDTETGAAAASTINWYGKLVTD